MHREEKVGAQISGRKFQLSADIFTSAIVAYALSAAWELGMLDEIEQSDRLDVVEFATQHDLHLPSVRALVETLSCRDVLDRRDDDTVVAGAHFAEMFEAKGFFYWLTRGSGHLFETLPRAVRNEERTGEFYTRDLRAVGVATRDMGRYFFDAPFHELLDDVEFETVADLGCGSAERLIRIARSVPGSNGVGVDISASALELADEAIRAAGLEDRIGLVRADARDLSPLRLFGDVDLVTCFLMGHDLWPREACVESLQKIRRSFPRVRRFVLCDTYRSQILPCPHPPMFTPGFELAHAVMGVELPTLTDWLDVFEDGGWRCLERRDIVTPSFTSMFILTPV